MRITTLDSNRIREFIKGNITFEDLVETQLDLEDTGSDLIDDVDSLSYCTNYKADDEINITLDDIVSTLKKFVRESKSLDEIVDGWFHNLVYVLGDNVGVANLIGNVNYAENSGLNLVDGTSVGSATAQSNDRNTESRKNSNMDEEESSEFNHLADFASYTHRYIGNGCFENEQELVCFIFSRLQMIWKGEWAANSEAKNEEDEGEREWYEYFAHHFAKREDQEEPAEVSSAPYLLQIKELCDIADNFKINRGKPHALWVLTPIQKELFIDYYDDQKRLDTADTADLVLYKKLVLELANENNIKGITTLGYAVYGDDNPVFDCDWELARDCMLKLTELAPDKLKAQAANTLGYIYYYGRCNGGRPQYEEAYKYFSLAAFFGYYEAFYKIGDMLRDGKGPFKNREAAYRLYRWVYEENFDLFLKENKGVLADVALRLGNCYQHGICVSKNLLEAYRYYLIAQVAINEAMKLSHFFGYKHVASNIKKSMGEVEIALGDRIHRDHARVNIVNLTNQVLLSESVREIGVKLVRSVRGYNMTLTRLKQPGYNKEPYMLLTFPTISYCKKSTDVTLFLSDTLLDGRLKKSDFVYDEVFDDGECIQFMSHGEPVFKLNDGNLVILGED